MPDEYELQSFEDRSVHSIGSGAGDDRILWFNQWWTVEDFLALLLAVDDFVVAQENSAYASDEQGQQIIHAEMSKPESERYLVQFLNDTVLATRRNELKWFFLVFAWAYDTRIARLFCKHSNVLWEELQFDGINASRVLAMNRAIPPLLSAYVRDQLKLTEIIALMLDAYTVCSTPIIGSGDEPVTDQLYETDADRPLFDPTLSVIDVDRRANQFVLNSSHPLTLELASTTVPMLECEEDE